jgi:signal peptidase I
MADSGGGAEGKAATAAAPTLAERARMRVAGELAPADEADDATPNAADLRLRRARRWIRRIRRILIAATIVMVVYGMMRFEIFTVPAGYATMVPTYSPGQRVIVDRHATFDGLRPIDIIIFAAGPESTRMARVAALPGSDVGVRRSATSGRLVYTVDGRRLDPVFPPPPEGTAPPGQVPADGLFVLEDALDPAGAVDSRTLTGIWVPADRLRGKVVLAWGGAAAETDTGPDGDAAGGAR